MTLAFLCVAIAFAAGLVGATPKRAALLGAVAGILAGTIYFLVEENYVHYSPEWEYLPATALLPCAASGLLAFAVAKLKR